MTHNHIIIFGIIEFVLFFVFLYLIIRANIVVNALQKEINELHLCLPVIIRDIRQDLSSLNSELSQYISQISPSPQDIGFIAGQVFTEILLFKIKSFRFGRKFLILSIILKAINIRKLFNHLLIFKNAR